MATKHVLTIVENNLIVAINLEGNYYSFYWSLVWPIVDSYWITCLYLFKLNKATAAIPLPKLYTQIQWFAQSLMNDRVSSYLEAISSDTIKNAVNMFIKMKFIASIKQESGGEQVSAAKLAVSE